MKAYLYTLEVLIATSIILVSLILIYHKPYTNDIYKEVLMKEYGENALEFLDANHTLRKLVYQENETALERLLRSYIPETILYEFSSNCDMINVPKNTTVITVVYYLAGYDLHYNPKRVCLYLWGAEE